MAEADLLVIGAGTIRSEDPTVLLPEEWSKQRIAAGRSPQPVRLVLSPSLSVSPSAKVVRADAPLVIAARPAEIDRRRGEFGPATELVPWSADVGRLLDDVSARHGAARVLCLGGGRTNAAFLAADRVDRLSLTICSFVIGAADAPGPFDGDGFSPDRFPQFRLEGTQPAGRDLVLLYRREREATPRGMPHEGRASRLRNATPRTP
jgi:diaminohydroxyphosphoribosylaminopyrimidine deaminase/5-amino-6-(5-phosphoribosylamino)uracil reductase